MSIARHLGILLGKAFGGVDENHADIRPVHRHVRAEDAVALHIFQYLGFSPDAGGIDEDKLPVLVFDAGIHSITGGSGDVRDNHPVFPGQTVDEGGFAYVGLADHGNFDRIVVLSLFLLGRQVFQHLIQKVAGTVAVNGGNGDGIA